MNAKLLLFDNGKLKREVALKLPAVLGRSRKAEITVGHPLISRRHCELSDDNGLIMLRDLASLNGTTVGGMRIELAPLLPGGEFAIGSLTFRVKYEYDGDLESVPSTRFADETADVAAAALSGQPGERHDEEDIPFAELDAGLEEALPAVPAKALADSASGHFSMPELMALADAEVDERLPPAKPQSVAPLGTPRPATAGGKPPARHFSDVLGEPLELESSLQSGGHGIESPWAKEPRQINRPQIKSPRPAAKAPGKESQTPSAEKPAKPPAAEKPKAAPPAKKPSPSGETEFDFLEGLE